MALRNGQFEKQGLSRAGEEAEKLVEYKTQQHQTARRFLEKLESPHNPAEWVAVASAATQDFLKIWLSG